MVHIRIALRTASPAHRRRACVWTGVRSGRSGLGQRRRLARPGRDAAVGQLDVELLAGSDDGCRAHRAALAVAHQSVAALQHAVGAERAEELAACIEMAPLRGDARAVSPGGPAPPARRAVPRRWRARRQPCGERRPATRSRRARRGPVVRTSEDWRVAQASSRSRARCRRVSSSRGCSRAVLRASRTPCTRVLASRARPRRCSTAS